MENYKSRECDIMNSYHPMAESEEELKSLVMKVKEELKKLA